MAEPLPLIAYDTLQEQTEALYRDGYVYLPSVLSADEIADLRKQMDNLTAIPESFDKHTDAPEHAFMSKSINNALTDIHTSFSFSAIPA